MKREITVNVIPTSTELAEEFCNMDADQQAVFFREIATISKTWERPLCYQLHEIIDSDFFDADAKMIMKTLGEYAT